jgi:hypothetical protein
MLIGFRWVGENGKPWICIIPPPVCNKTVSREIKVNGGSVLQSGWMGGEPVWMISRLPLPPHQSHQNPMAHTYTHTVMMMPEQLLLKSYVPIVGQQQQQQQELICVLFTLHHGLTLSLHPLYTCVCVQPRKKIIKPQSIIFQLTLSPSCHACQQSKFTGYSNQRILTLPLFWGDNSSGGFV